MRIRIEMDMIQMKRIRIGWIRIDRIEVILIKMDMDSDWDK